MLERAGAGDEDAFRRLVEPHGPHAVGLFLRAAASWRPDRRFALAPTRANGHPAFVCSLDGQSAGVIVLAQEAGRLGAITHFLDPSVYEYFTRG